MYQALLLRESPEKNIAPVIDDTSNNGNGNFRYYEFFQLPTTYPLWKITGIEWANGGNAPAGQLVTCGVDLVDANPPLSSVTLMVALGKEIALAGINQPQRNNDIKSNLIRAGSFVGVWLHYNAQYLGARYKSGAPNGYNKEFTYSANPAPYNASGYFQNSFRLYLRCYFRGYK